jgi:predicted pyridoxine 5'-phosphate oxidase superfamily flavin-nucleotide-binding protein
MKRPISDIAFTPAVKAAQERLGSRRAYARMEERREQGPWRDVVTPDLAEFIAERDSLYLGTASADGQPYIQHRGGPKGFLKVLDEHTPALADYAGNSQYISLGNLSENNKAFIFLMDYPNRQRIKIWGTAEFIEDDRELLSRVVDADYKARPERILMFRVKAWSPNCNLHIRQRFTAEEMEPMFQQLRRRIEELEEMNATLRKRLGDRPEVVEKEAGREINPPLKEETPTEGEGCGVERE